MARHRAPEPEVARNSVVLMDTARSSRLRSASAAPVDFSVAEAVVDDLTLITADDLMLDRIAAGQGDVFVDFSVGTATGPGVLAPLLATWRADIVDPQWPDAPTVDEAIIAAAAPRARPARRALRPILGVAVAIGALLFGSAAIGAQHAQPGDTLWPLAKVLYSDHATSVQAGLAVKASLGRAQNALDHHQPSNALVALTSASGEVEKVLTTDGKEALQVQVKQLWNQANSSLQAATPSGTPSPAGVNGSGAPVVGPPTTLDPARSTSTGKAAATATAASASGSGKATGSASAPARPSTAGATTAPAPTTGASSRPIVPPPVVIPSTTAGTPTPTAPGTSSTDVPTTSDPGTTPAPSSTDPGTPTSSDQPTTEVSTTSELPTPTQTPDTPTGDGVGAQGLSVDGTTTPDQ